MYILAKRSLRIYTAVPTLESGRFIARGAVDTTCDLCEWMIPIAPTLQHLVILVINFLANYAKVDMVITRTDVYLV